MVSLESHPERNVIRLQLKQNIVIKDLNEAEIERARVAPGRDRTARSASTLLQQGVREMGQYFILDGVLKRVVSNKDREGDDPALRRRARHRRRATRPGGSARRRPTASSRVTKARVAQLPLHEWVAFIGPAYRRSSRRFEYEVMQRDERDHGPHDHAAPARCAGPRAPLHAQAHRRCSTAYRRRSSPSYLNISAGDAEPAQAPGQDLSALPAAQPGVSAAVTSPRRLIRSGC
mgnify:CR=1 FL=1